MFVEQLHIENFRNLVSADLSLNSGFNYLYGANGAGKTAVLEALYMLARGRSFRTSRALPLIRKGEDALLVRADISGVESAHRLGMRKTSSVTEMRLDGMAVSRTSDLARHLPLQILLPDASGLVFQGPGVRRSFLDWGLFHVEPTFLGATQRYRRTLIQRNAWLKSKPGGRENNDPWRQQLVEHGVQINGLRARYVHRLRKPFSELMAVLMPTFTVGLGYDPGGWDSVGSADKRLGEAFARDVKFGVTHHGPHRADLIISASPAGNSGSGVIQEHGPGSGNDRTGRPSGAQSRVEGEARTGKAAGADASNTLSRGQAKLVASAAILAQAVLQRELTGVRSVFLIDDFGAELDPAHWRSFSAALQSLACQVIATSTLDPKEHGGWMPHSETTVFHVEHGEITRL